MTGYSVFTLPVTGIYKYVVFSIFCTHPHACLTQSHLYMHAHTPILEICLLEQVWKALSVFPGCTTRVYLIFFEILQETETSKVVVKVDMMVFAF